MEWQEVCDNKYLQDLPFKIELNKWGQIVMSPAKPKHSILQGLIANLLNSLLAEGMAFPECAIATQDNVKVADVVWASDSRLNIIENESFASIASEICVEVKSASNTLQEIVVKKDLYFAAQAQEVWLCNAKGEMRFFATQGELERSLLVPDFPKQVTRKKSF